MIKKLIFDIDNTLIEWKDSYSFITVEETYKKLNIKYDDKLIDNVNLAILNYENYYDIYKKEYLLNAININTNQNLPLEFIDIFLNNCINYALPSNYPKENIDTLNYLSSKYELVALTNWFASPQIERLKKLDIYKYFSIVLGTENVKCKPNKECFLAAIGTNKPNECYMIGDTFNTDIKGALNAGLNAIYLTSSPIQLDNCVCIDKFEELKNIL